MDHVVVSRNTAHAQGPAGTAQGGIWNGDLITGPPALTLENSAVIGKALEGSSVSGGQGGGLFTRFPIVSVNTVIAGTGPTKWAAHSGIP